MQTKLRAVTAIAESDGKKLRRQPIPPPPKIAWLALDQLVIDESYQRGISENSRRLIRRLVETWDWNCFKPLSVAASGGGLYEVVDGQHSAMAAATHGAIETLPCLVLDAVSRAERSKAFVGINRDRVPLTPFALYRARLAGEEEEACAVQAALEATGAALVESLRYDVDYPAGTVACISTLLQIVRRGGKARLARLLRIAIAAEIGPVPSALLKGLEIVVSGEPGVSDIALTDVLADMGGEDLIDQARSRCKAGGRINEAAAELIKSRLRKAA